MLRALTTDRGPLALNERAEQALAAFELPVLLAALAVVPVMIVEERWPSDGWLALANAANWAIWSMFFVGFVVLITLAGNRWRYARSAWLDVVVIVCSFPTLPVIMAITRLARLVRLAPALRRLRFVVEDEEEVIEETHEIRQRMDEVQAQLDRIEAALVASDIIS